MSTQKVPFWLEVKPEYVTENFDKLVDYLSACSLNINDIGDISDPECDFYKTYSVLKEVVYDRYEDNISKIKIYEISTSAASEITFTARLIGSYLLCAKMYNECDYRMLGTLVDILVANNIVKAKDSLEELQKIVYHCMKNSVIENYGFSWNEIKSLTENGLEIFGSHLCKTSFNNTNIDTCDFEGRGLLLLKADTLLLSNLNYQQISNLLVRNKLANQFVLPGMNVIRASRDCATIKDFDCLKDICREIDIERHNYIPTPIKNKKIYDLEHDTDEILVRITDKSTNFLVAETVDSAYERIEGKIYVKPNLHGITYDMFISSVNVGNYLKVHLQDRTDMPFILDQSFDDFYFEEAKMCDRNLPAVYLEPYSLGKKWLTEVGVTVNIRDNSDEVEDAISLQQVINVKLYDSKKDKNGNCVVNASYEYPLLSDDYEDTTSEEFKEQAYQTLLESFLEYCEPDIEIKEDKLIAKFDPTYIPVLINIAYYISSRIRKTRERYALLTAIKFMAGVIDDTVCIDYIQTERHYISCLVDFAKGKIASNHINFTPEASCVDFDAVRQMVRMIKRINSYNETDLPVPAIADEFLSDNELYDTVDGLIYSSNRLNGKINRPEINRIKKTIAKHLKVEDEYENITSELTYYGEESDTLEFKTSIIFSPNETDKYSNAQIWEILKAICAFMNTTTGGEILLGVRDSGYSCGLKKDIDYMHHNRMIPELTLDRYRTYLKDKVDQVFEDDSDMARDAEITTGRVSYLIERNKEGDDILHIQVRPYEYGLVQFHKEQERPDGIAQTYIRRSGDSFPMNSELKRQAKEKKLNASYDGNLKKFVALQLAAKEEKIVKLVNYTSHNGTKDRIVEPFHPIPEQNAFLVYDLDNNENREYKIPRMEDVIVLDRKWTKKNKHRKLCIDLFAMVQDLKVKPVEIELKLKPLPYNLLMEEYRNAGKYLKENHDGEDNAEYPWVLKTTVYKMEGIGRFYIGLAKYIKIVKGEQLKEYVKRYIADVTKNL